MMFKLKSIVMGNELQQVYNLICWNNAIRELKFNVF